MPEKKLKLRFFILFKLTLLIIITLISGCSAIDTSNLHDERFKSGCAVVNANYAGMYVNGNMAACKLVCSDKLPKGYKYHYQSAGCNVSIGD